MVTGSTDSGTSAAVGLLLDPHPIAPLYCSILSLFPVYCLFVLLIYYSLFVLSVFFFLSNLSIRNALLLEELRVEPLWLPSLQPSEQIDQFCSICPLYQIYLV